MKFPILSADNRSLANRKKVRGVGVNDADYQVQPNVKGKKLTCPYYKRWSCMLDRCYSGRSHESQPSYAGCTVCKEWLLFSNFKGWMIKQDWQDKHLDKDILVQGNKIYSPSTCLFVSGDINSLLVEQSSCRGLHPRGVHYQKAMGKFQSSCKVNNKGKHLGYYSTASEASLAYKDFKYELIRDIASKQSEPLRSALLAYKIST